MNIIDRFIARPDLTKEEYIELINQWKNPEAAARLKEEAVRLRQLHYGDKIFIRGLIEFTNYCKNNCYYCGIRRGNKNVKRYRLTKEEIMSCCEQGYALGFRTFVLQGGEDPYFTDERIVDIVSSIKKEYPDCAVTLSIGEKSYESYTMYKEAGADRYLLRHETANEAHYRILHPEEMSLSVRKQCLRDLKTLGYQTGAGFMVGSPGQTVETLAEDLLFLQELQPEMVGIGPFLPHCDTDFKDEPGGNVELTLYLLSVIRILLPEVLLPATTALGTAEKDGKIRGILCGANVVMPNLSPVVNRKQYALYNDKACMDEEAAEGIRRLEASMNAIGYKVVYERGDAANQRENI